jgi:nucleoside-triphosphatase THEP1
MNDRHAFSDVWLKASILGANWAVSEIILGSFLHNLHVPFKGNILTAIGLILLISAAYKWKDKGLFWRSGLICALMKTMSPSAVIFGPMVAIFMEALLLEMAVQLIGRNIAGFLMGSSLAMSWVLVQKIINLVLFYGTNIIDIYADLLKYAEQQLNLQYDIFWLPLLVLLGLYVLFGFIATFIGVRIGAGLMNNREIAIFEKNRKPLDLKAKPKQEFQYSIGWLVFSFIGLILALILINRSPVFVWTLVSAVLVVVWAKRYNRALRQLSRPKFWIFFITITCLSALLITSMNGESNTWTLGLMTGLQMNFRAAVVISGFSVLGTEFYNPRIRRFLSHTAFKQLPYALELSFESLPFIIANLPDAKTFVKNPVEVVKLLIRHAENRFSELKNRQQKASVFIVSAGIAEGKTAFIKELAGVLQTNSIVVGGFYAPRIIQDHRTIGYDLVSVETGESYNFLRIKQDHSIAYVGMFEINSYGIGQGRQILSAEKVRGKDIVIIDEIGRLELDDKGWNRSLKYLLTVSELCLILAVRKDFLVQVIEKFCMHHAEVLPVSSTTILEARDKILHQLNRNKS